MLAPRAGASTFHGRRRTRDEMGAEARYQLLRAPDAPVPHRLSSSAPSPRDNKRKIGAVSQPHAHPSPSNEPKRRKRRSREYGKRKWVHSSRDCSPFKDRFVLVSYNVLGDENASKHADLYDQVDPEHLEWKRRRRRICKEISHYDAGILCLQEVDRFDDLVVHLQKGGFSGVYKGRTGEAVDGCAIFWRESRFKILHQESIEFQDFGLRNNVAQLCVFKMNPDDPSTGIKENSGEAASPSSCTFIVGNIHVLFNPNRGDIKLGQVRLLLEKAHTLSQSWGSCPVVIAGDWNCMPHSALYQFLCSSKLDIGMHDRRKISAQGSSWKQTLSHFHYGGAQRGYTSFATKKFTWRREEIHLAVGREGTTNLHHPLKLLSAYAGVPGSSWTRDEHGEPLVTSYHSKFMGTVDYIWHSPEIVPVRVLDTLPINIIRKTGGLPSQNWGSDHLSLVCELAFETG